MRKAESGSMHERLLRGGRFFAPSLLLALSSCGPTKPDWNLAPAIQPTQISALNMNPDGRPATLPATMPTTMPRSQRATTAPVQAELRIDQIRDMALRNNLNLKTYLYSPQIARTRVSQEEAKFESTFFTEAQLRTTDLPRRFDPNGGLQSNDQSVTPGIRVPLRTGGQLQFSSPLDRTKTEGLDPYYGTGLDASISQPLLRGAGQDQAEYSIRIAGYNERIAQVDTRLNVITILAAVDRTYWRLYAARELLKVRQQQYDLARQLLERARRLVAAGQAAEIEVIRAESGVADQLDSIIRTENIVRTQERELKRLLNEPDFEESTILIPATKPALVHYATDPQHLIDAAMANRAELLRYQLQLAQDALAIGYAKNQMLPSLAASYTYRISGIGDVPADAYDMTFQRNYDDHAARLVLEVPIGNEAAKSQFRRALLQRQLDLSSQAAQSLQIRKEVLDAIDTIEAAWNRILASQSRTLLAARTLQAEQRQFEQGLRTATDVLDAQTRLADAQASEISALTDYQISQIDLAYATGTLLGQAKVDWEKQIPADESRGGKPE